MGDVLTKLRILAGFLQAAYDEWRTYVWQRDLDAPYCCDGRECGCGAETVRSIYSEVRR